MWEAPLSQPKTLKQLCRKGEELRDTIKLGVGPKDFLGEVLKEGCAGQWGEAEVLGERGRPAWLPCRGL